MGTINECKYWRRVAEFFKRRLIGAKCTRFWEGHCLNNDAWNKDKTVLPNLDEIEILFVCVEKNVKWERYCDACKQNPGNGLPLDTRVLF